MENQDKQPLRQIIIETNGVSVKILKSEVYSLLEFNSILNMVYDYINTLDVKKVFETPKIEESMQKDTKLGTKQLITENNL